MTLYAVIAPALHGTNLSHWDNNNTDLTRLMNSDLAEPIAGDYMMSNVSILIHELGTTPNCLMRNRIIGQTDPPNEQVKANPTLSFTCSAT